MKEKLETQEFYELMQQYRHSRDNGEAQKSYEAVKSFIINPYKAIY